MNNYFCPHCDGQAEVCEVSVSVGLADDRDLHGWAWCCAKCGAQGPVLSTELESLDNLVTYSQAKAMLPLARARMEEVLGQGGKAMLTLALAELEEVLQEGAKTHPPGDWRELGELGNLMHAQEHLEEFEHYEQTEDLAHAFVRLGMALQLRLERKGNHQD